MKSSKAHGFTSDVREVNFVSFLNCKAITIYLLSALLAVQVVLSGGALLSPHTGYGMTEANPGENGHSIDNSNINQLPLIQPLSSPQTEVDEGDTVVLDASRTHDPDGRVVKYLWTQTEGPSVGALPGVPVTRFKAPFLADNSDVRLEFQLTVIDDRGGTVSAMSIALVVKNVNHHPVAYSTSVHVTSDMSGVVSLKGSDPDGDPLTFFPTLLSTKTLHGKIGTVVDSSTSSAETTARMTYFPDPGYTGSDSFTYQAVDTSNAVSNVATINLIISK